IGIRDGVTADKPVDIEAARQANWIFLGEPSRSGIVVSIAHIQGSARVLLVEWKTAEPRAPHCLGRPLATSSRQRLINVDTRCGPDNRDALRHRANGRAWRRRPVKCL